MFIDTGDSGGSKGPWLAWTSEGSARKGFKPESWVLRDKDANGDKMEAVVEAFYKGCVLDLDSLKLGWEKDGGAGKAPERRWNPSISQALPRPDESKKASGGYAWTQALSVRVAFNQEAAATWEQGSFGAYRAFTKLAQLINAQYPGDGTLPFVKQTGVEHIKLSNGSTAVPILEIMKWVQRPDCLKEQMGIATEPPAAPAPQPAQQPAQPARPSFVPDDEEIPF